MPDPSTCDPPPDSKGTSLYAAEELTRFERNLVALWRAIERATEQRDFRPQPSRLCDWCSHQSRCPAYGGTPPPFPEPVPPPEVPAEALLVAEE